MEALNNIYIILLLPKKAGNVGSVARVLKNFNVEKLRIVTKKKITETFEAKKMAVHAEDVLSGAEIFSNLQSAIKDLNVIIGATGKKHKEIPERLNIRDLGNIISLSQKNKIGILFGPEDRGLSNDEISLCNFSLTIPTSKKYSSLNLSHSVAVVLYEIFQQYHSYEPSKRVLASKESMERLYERMKEVYLEIGFLDKINPERILKVLKNIYDRALLNEREVRILMGVLKQTIWFKNRSKS